MKYNAINEKKCGVESQYQLLANAIVMQAVKDYRFYTKKQLKSPDDAVIDGQIKLLEKFFKSGWFGELCNLDMKYLLDKVKKETIEEAKQEKLNRKNKNKKSKENREGE